MDASLDRDRRASRLLHEHADELRRLGVRHLGIVGSLARDEATLSSDVDMLIEVAADRPFSLWALGEVRVRLSEILGREAGTSSSPRNLSRVLRESLVPDLLPVF